MMRNIFNNGKRGGRQGMRVRSCVCPKCGYEVAHERGVPCRSLFCPHCNIPLVPGDGEAKSFSANNEPIVPSKMINATDNSFSPLKKESKASTTVECHMEVNESLCVGCGLCARVCPQEAITIIDKICHIDASKCVCCQKCADACRKGAIKLVG